MAVFAELAVAIVVCQFMVRLNSFCPLALSATHYPMKINRSVLIAIFAIVAIGLWFLVNSGKHDDKSSLETSSTTSEKPDEAITVIVESRQASKHQVTYTLYGRSEADKEVSVKAETAGLVVSTPITEGRTINKGTVLCRQDVDARQAGLDQAKALLRTRELEYKAAKTLVEKGYRSETQAATAEAALDGAKASVKQAEIELDNVNMRAPFSGIFEQQIAEVGDYLGPGQPCGLLVDLDPLVVSSELTEVQIKDVKVGQIAQIKLATGESISGKVRFIEAKSDPSTRTFRAEVSVPNPGYKLKGGVTATVQFEAGIVEAQHVPSHILALDDQGILGVRFVDANNRVDFRAVTTIDEDKDGIWVTGLPSETRIIVKGQNYVSVGTLVDSKNIIEASE